jgi:pyruvate dehydrogenase E1 component
VLASTIPCILAYDPAFAYEVAAIVRDGLERMYVKGEDVFYYITLYNQDYPMPALPAGVEDGILRGLYLYRGAVQQAKHRAQIFGSGPTMLAALRAQEILAERFDVAADVWSATSYQQLRDDALRCERWNRLHPAEPAKVPYVTRTLESAAGPVVAATDYLKAVPDMVARWIPRPFTSLGTDGFGRSDTRDALRRFFEVDAEHIVVAALSSLCQQGLVPAGVVTKAIQEFGIGPDYKEPWVQ